MVKTMRVAVVLAALTMMSVPSFAQGGGGRQGGGGGFGGGGFGGGFGGGQFGRAAGPLTTIQVPASLLGSALKLSADQVASIKKMQDKLDEQRKAMRPQGFGGGAAGGGGFDREAMQQMMEEMRAKQEQLRSDETKASKAVDAMLNAEQSAALKAALPDWTTYNGFGLLAQAEKLNFSKEQLATLAQVLKDRAAAMPQGGRRGGGGN